MPKEAKAENTKIVVRLPDSMRVDLEAIAAAEHRDISKQVRFILSEYLKEKEVTNAD